MGRGSIRSSRCEMLGIVRQAYLLALSAMTEHNTNSGDPVTTCALAAYDEEVAG